MTKTISNSEPLNVESIIDSWKGRNGSLLGALEQAQQNDPKNISPRQL